MTSMTIIDELLVLLDDEQSRSLEMIGQALSGRSKQTLSSTLGRLISKGWVKRGAGRNRRLYQTTPAGQQYVTDHLGAIKQVTDRTWDESWEQIIYNIPERDRKRRDDLRNLLVSLGYGRIHNSLWLSPWSHAEAINEYIQDTKSQNDITRFSTGKLTAAVHARIAQLFEWDWQNLDAEYEQFIQEAKLFLLSRTKSSFEARKIVFHYAKILSTDPKMPALLTSHLRYAAEAYKQYELVRPFCYER